MKVSEKCKSEDYAVKYCIPVPISLDKPEEGNIGIEAAFIHLPEREDNKPKSILCLSSMVGCYYDCLMCANAGKTFHRSLTSKEINEQIKLILEQDNNLETARSEGAVEYAFMGIGEPLFGMNVLHAIQQHSPLVDKTEFSLATIADEGALPRLIKTNLLYPVRLELSLHFPNDTLRNQWIMSVSLYKTHEPKLNINRMMREAEEFHSKSGKRVTLNYMVIDGINNTQEHLEQLLGIVKGREEKFYVKVMEPNHTSSLTESHKEDIPEVKTYTEEEFQQELEKRGIHATLFKSKGIDIRAGCGMMTTRD